LGLAARRRIREHVGVTESESENEAEEQAPGRIGDEEGVGEAPDAVFHALWGRVLEAWDDDKPHALALSYAIEHQMLPEIAGRYRKLLDDPEKGARAKKKIDGIVVAATQLLMATKSEPRQKVPWTWTASVAIVMVLVIAFLAYKLFAHR
jgi:hypothetical protein